MRGLGIRWVLAAAVCLAVGDAAPAQQQGGQGEQLYLKYCSQCHGDDGDGLGIAAARVKPAPRDFTTGKYKFRTTPSGALPTDADIARVIKRGLPYTSMPAWPQLTDPQIDALVQHLKTFSPTFDNPDKIKPPISIPEPPPLTPESVESGRTVYQQQGCAACHGELGRGDGPSAPTLKDEWGDHIRAADMTMRWTFRGGPTRTDIYRTFSTGVNGTPMPSYYDSLDESARWALVDYVYSLGESDAPDYSSLLIVHAVEDELDLDDAELFEPARPSRFPLIGQIVQDGRSFYPPTTSAVVRAVYNREQIAFQVRWNDMRAETTGHNDPTLEVPGWQAQNHHAMQFAFGSGASGGESDDEGDDFWGADVVDEQESADDFWGEDAAGADDFWGEAEGEEEAVTADREFSDAVALQFPVELSRGPVKPYFILGQSGNPVDVWFLDTAKDFVQQYRAQGSDSLEITRGDDFEIRAEYEKGHWTVVFKRDLRSTSNLTFTTDQFVPISFSVWDGFNRERGNKRALSSWFYLYLKPQETPSPTVPMVRAGLIALFIELIVIVLVRRRYRPGGEATAEEVDRGAQPEAAR